MSVASCPVCSYPLKTIAKGTTTVCAYCGTPLESIAQDVSIPTPVFVGVLCFFGGMLFGPSLIAGTSEGRGWLEEQTRKAIRK
mgnify:CR=1 FL=1